MPQSDAKLQEQASISKTGLGADSHHDAEPTSEGAQGDDVHAGEKRKRIQKTQPTR